MADVKPEDQFAQAHQAPGSAPGGKAQAAARKPAAAQAAQQQRDAAGETGQTPGDPPPGKAGSGPLNAPGEVRVPDGVAWLVADEPLYIGDPEAAAAPVRAYNPGDQVAASQVDRYGWHAQTHIPEWASAPPAPAPDTSSSEEQT